MKLRVLGAFIILISVTTHAFDGCTAYFSGHFENNKNKPLSSMMQTLQESIWVVQDFARNAKGLAIDPSSVSYLSALDHTNKIARIAQGNLFN
jgi:hypothetical protein